MSCPCLSVDFCILAQLQAILLSLVSLSPNLQRRLAEPEAKGKGLVEAAILLVPRECFVLCFCTSDSGEGDMG